MKDGRKFEDKLAKDLELKKTARSGAHWDNGDLSDSHVIIEAKSKTSPYFKPVKSEIKKVQDQATKHGKDWAYIQETDGGTFVVTDYQFFLEMWQMWRKYR